MTRFNLISMRMFLLCAGAIVKIAFAENTMPLIELSKLDAGGISISNATVAAHGNALSVRGDGSRGQATVQIPLPDPMRDLSKWGFVEIDLENKGDVPLTFTFWALSGNGWGGVSTWSTDPEILQTSAPDKPKSTGREVLAPKEWRTFKIDLYACYPKPDASGKYYTRAINPASVRWLKLVLSDLSEVLVHEIKVSGEAPKVEREYFKRILVPDIERGEPMAGKRVYQKLPGWENTAVEHVLTLPKEWKPEAKFPIIVEYTGNMYYHKWCHSTGYTDQGNMAYGLSQGETFILLNLPLIATEGQKEAFQGWGSLEKSEDYCLQALKFVSENYGGDMNQVFFSGFSRGELAMNYFALRTDRIAPIWRGFIGANPAVSSAKKWSGGTGSDKYGPGWDERGARLQGRPFISQHPSYGDVHVDVEYLEDSPSTLKVRAWLREMLGKPNP